MTDEKDVLMDHDYDGIQELDNDLPPWWLWLFYITIAWAVIYMIHYHVLRTGDSQITEYHKEMDPNWTPAQDARQAGSGLFYHSPFYNSKGDMTPRLRQERKLAELKAAEEKAKLAAADKGEESATGSADITSLSFDELLKAAMRKADPANLEKLQTAFPEIYASLDQKPAEGAGSSKPAEPKIEALTDAASLGEGKAIYTKNCASCHGNEGQGGIGPNFTDDYWLHGAGMNNVVHTINNGVPAKGMISWKPILKEDEILKVASYILSLHGTNPPNPKKPQGDKVDYPL